MPFFNENGGRMRVLMVDDDEDDFVLIGDMLREGFPAGIEVEYAPGTTAALALIDSRPYDVFLFDYRLGGEDGIALAREVRARRLETPVILLTGQGGEGVAVEAMKAGAIDYLAKGRLDANSLKLAIRYARNLARKEHLLRHARDEVLASERRFRALVENAWDATQLVDEHGDILWASNSNQRLFGFEAAQLVGRNAFGWVHPEDTATAGEIFSRCVAVPSTSVLCTFRHRHQDGSWRDVEGVGTNCLADPAVRAVVMNLRDVTEQRRAEQALRTSESHYRTLFERNLAGVFRATLDGVMLECNDALVRMHGYASQQEFLADHHVIFRDHKLAERVRAQGQLANVEVECARKDGTPLVLFANLTVLSEAADQPPIIEGTVLDVTERRALQEQLHHAQKMDAVGRLAGGVAHDFNNLLMVISSYSELMLDHLEDPRLRRNAEEVLKAARRAASLTQQLLAFSRKQVLAPRVLDLNSVVAEIVRILPRLIGEDIQVVVRATADLGKVIADPVQMDQVLMNLAANARDAMPTGGKLVVETANARLTEQQVAHRRPMPPGHYVMLRVSDTGEGIDPAVQARIFEPFFTTKEQGKGTGLGLSTVYGIIKQSGGFIWLSSEPGKGATFEIFLPRVEQTVMAAPTAVECEPKATGSETILLVEDEEAVRDSTGEFLRSRGYTVLRAINGADALRVARSFPGTIDLLITDVVMPGMSGRELAELLMALRPSLKVLYVSGYAESTMLRHGVVDLATMFLQKPCTLAALARKVREIIDGVARPPAPGARALAAPNAG